MIKIYVVCDELLGVYELLNVTRFGHLIAIRYIHCFETLSYDKATPMTTTMLTKTQCV